MRQRHGLIQGSHFGSVYVLCIPTAFNMRVPATIGTHATESPSWESIEHEKSSLVVAESWLSRCHLKNLASHSVTVISMLWP